jgi:addiction module HigA family antidote
VGTTTKLLKAYGLPTHRPPTSPGETVAHFLEDLDLSQAEAARALGMSANRLNEVVKNKRGISADTALRLAAYFGTSAQFWLNVQGAWDLWHELQRGSKTYGTILQRRPRAVREAAREASVPAS